MNEKLVTLNQKHFPYIAQISTLLDKDVNASLLGAAGWIPDTGGKYPLCPTVSLSGLP